MCIRHFAVMHVLLLFQLVKLVYCSIPAVAFELSKTTVSAVCSTIVVSIKHHNVLDMSWTLLVQKHSTCVIHLVLNFIQFMLAF